MRKLSAEYHSRYCTECAHKWVLPICEPCASCIDGCNSLSLSEEKTKIEKSKRRFLTWGKDSDEAKNKK